MVFNLHVIIEKCDRIGHPVEYVLETCSKGPPSPRSSAPVQSSVNQAGLKSSLPGSVPEPNTKESVVPETSQPSSKRPSTTVGEGIVKREETDLPSYVQGSNIDSKIAEGSIASNISSMFDLSDEALATHCNYYCSLAQDYAVQLSKGFRSTCMALEAEQALVEALKNELLEVEGRRMEAESRLAAEKAARQEEIAKLQVKLAKALEDGYSV